MQSAELIIRTDYIKIYAECNHNYNLSIIYLLYKYVSIYRNV